MTTETRVHVLWSRGHYIGQLRKFGHRKYETVTGRCATMEAALAAAAKRMKNYHRIRVLFIDSNPYYGPNVAMEGTRV